MHRIGRKLRFQNGSEPVNLQEFIKSGQDSRSEVFADSQRTPVSVNQQFQRTSQQPPKKRKQERTSFNQQVLFKNKTFLREKSNIVRQTQSYACANINSPTGMYYEQPFQNKDLQIKHLSQPFYQKATILRNIIKKHKIKSIVSNFIKKIKRVTVLKDPIQFKQFKKQNEGFLHRVKGFQIPQTVQDIISLVSILQIIIFSIFFSLSLVYKQLQNSKQLLYVESFTCFFLLLDIFFHLLTVKYSSGKKMKILVQIWSIYIEGYLVIDCLGFIILLINIISQSTFIGYFKFIILLKIPQCMKNIEKIEVSFFKNLYNEQYWSLVKIFLFNLSFAHIISILLTAMATLSPQNNWMSQKGIDISPWYQKYSWAYYWANTIMLTVGFGDIIATNYKQAICLVFIQTFSCMVFAYNINCIGGIIQHIIAKDAQRSRKSKIFTKLQSKNKLSDQLCQRINNYIEQTAKLRKNFNYEQEKEFITNLPVQMKKEYLKESNKNIFQNIQFFKSFINKTLYNLAQKIEMRVSHPQEIVQHIYDDYNLIILKNGSLGLAYKRADFQLKKLIMDRIVVKQKQNPSLVNLDFIVRKRPIYQIKSMQYAIFYFLPYEKLIQILRQTEMDFQYFCTLRDRIKNIPDQFQVLSCQLCNGKHLKALCPKLHYIPFHQTIIHRYLHQHRVSCNFRQSLDRIRRIKKNNNVFIIYKKSIQNLNKLGSIISRRRNRSGQDNNQSFMSESSDSDKVQPTFVEKQIEIMHLMMRLTNQAIKEQINKLIKSDSQEDEVWMIKSDSLCDFNAYFPQHNPYNIYSRYIEIKELSKSENLLKAHTSVLMQQIHYNQFSRYKVYPKKISTICNQEQNEMKQF